MYFNIFWLLFISFGLVTFSEGAIKCMDDWTECSGAKGPHQGQCSADSCSISLVPVTNCGSFMLRTCSVDFDCYKSLSGGRKEFFNIKRVGPNSLAYDYCCSDKDYCNNYTETQLVAKLCEWVKENLPKVDLANNEIRSLCGFQVHSPPPVDNAFPVQVLPSLRANTRPNSVEKLKDSPLKCACDLHDVPGRFAQCRSPSAGDMLFGRTNADLLPHCYSSDGSCSLFMTLDMLEGSDPEIFRGCVDRKLPVSSCQNAGSAGNFVDADPLATPRPPYVFEYCCGEDDFCNSLTIGGAKRRMCVWVRNQLRRSNRQRNSVLRPRSGTNRRRKATRLLRQQNALQWRQNRKYVQIYQAYCQEGKY